VRVDAEILIRLQMARIFLRPGDVILITEPDKFIDDVCRELFLDFVKFMADKKTVLWKTNNRSLFVYSGKILYIGEHINLFGSHAELSTDENYRNFLTKTVSMHKYDQN
jgi:ABC-type Mn2+/Zn2+ transport system ATPase subunit